MAHPVDTERNYVTVTLCIEREFTVTVEAVSAIAGVTGAVEAARIVVARCIRTAHSRCFTLVHVYTRKSKVFPYSLPSVGPGADPGVQAGDAGDVK